MLFKILAGVALLAIFHFYLLPQYLIDFVQSFFSRKQLVFSADTRRHAQSESVVALTIDDAPTANTADILDLLHLFNIKATFFVISSYTPGREAIMDRIVSEGHEISNHTTVDAASWRMSAEIFESSLVQCEKALQPWMAKNMKSKNISTPSIKWFRPGHGLVTPSMLRTLARHGYRTAIANVYPNDAQGPF
eukprot:gene5821-11744_t